MKGLRRDENGKWVISTKWGEKPPGQTVTHNELFETMLSALEDIDQRLGALEAKEGVRSEEAAA